MSKHSLYSSWRRPPLGTAVSQRGTGTTWLCSGAALHCTGVGRLCTCTRRGSESCDLLRCKLQIWPETQRMQERALARAKRAPARAKHTPAQAKQTALHCTGIASRGSESHGIVASHCVAVRCITLHCDAWLSPAGAFQSMRLRVPNARRCERSARRHKPGRVHCSGTRQLDSSAAKRQSERANC